MPEARQNNSKLAEMLASASIFRALVGMAVDVVGLFMALLSFVESAPRAYRLKASNAAPPFSTSAGTSAYEDLPADDYKTGRYVYLVDRDSDVLTVSAKSGADISHGTLVRHFGYDLSNYTASIGPKSLYGALQRVLFDPVSSIRLENKVAGWNRTIKGSRNALNGATDQGDDSAKGPDIDYHLPLFNVSLGDHGDIGIEYWVLARPESKDGKKTSKPSRSFVDDTKPIILTHNGQNQDEWTGRIIKKDADLPFLQAQGRLIVNVNCDRLSPAAKRLLFSSTREKSREGFLQNKIIVELIELLKSDDELKRLNDEARDQSLKDKDEAAEKEMQRQVAKLLRIVGPAVVEAPGVKSVVGPGPAVRPRPDVKLKVIEPKEPPTYIKILGDKDDKITFYGGQRKYLRVETDANSNYHDADDPEKSRINIAVGADLKVFGTSPLRGGRMRIGVQCSADVALGSKGGIRVELYRPGLSALSDERDYLIVETPKPKEEGRKTSFPLIKVIAVAMKNAPPSAHNSEIGCPISRASLSAWTLSARAASGYPSTHRAFDRKNAIATPWSSPKRSAKGRCLTGSYSAIP
jgi:hypothetical protein